MGFLERKLNSVGMSVFVRYFDDFKNCTDDKKLAEKIMKEQGYKSYAAQLTRVRSAKSIFRGCAQNDALGLIIRSKRLDAAVIAEAKRLKDALNSKPADMSDLPTFTLEAFARDLKSCAK